MGVPIPRRLDFDGPALRCLARTSVDAAVRAGVDL